MIYVRRNDSGMNSWFRQCHGGLVQAFPIAMILQKSTVFNRVFWSISNALDLYTKCKCTLFDN